MHKLFFIVLFSIISCSPNMKIEEKNGFHVVSDIEAEIVDVDIIDWKVGKKREAKVSKGLKVQIEVNAMSESIRSTLTQKYGIDSLLFRIKKNDFGQTTIQGYVLIPFINMLKHDLNFDTHLYYTSAAASDYFRSAECPAYNHRSEIDDYEFTSPSNPEIVLFASNPNHFGVRSANITDLPIVVDAGKSMRGTFFAEMALYSVSKKELFGRFVPIKGLIKVTKEKQIDVQSCAGVIKENEALPSGSRNRMQDLEIH